MGISFSIITVSLNNRSGLLRTAQSIQNQTSGNYEWVVIDGGSSDGTVAWLEQSKARWTSEPDNGIYDAMNKGIAQARGDYLLFLNAGDCFADSDVLAKVTQHIGSSHPPDFIYGDSLEERAGLPPAYKGARSHTQTVYGMFTHHQAMLYRRETLGDLRYDTAYRIAADYKLTAQFLEKSKKIIYEPFPFCLFEPGGVSQKQVRVGRHEQFAIRRENNICPSWKNVLVFGGQSSMMALRRTVPALYWRLKGRSISR